MLMVLLTGLAAHAPPTAAGRVASFNTSRASHEEQEPRQEGMGSCRRRSLRDWYWGNARGPMRAKKTFADQIELPWSGSNYPMCYLLNPVTSASDKHFQASFVGDHADNCPSVCPGASRVDNT